MNKIEEYLEKLATLNTTEEELSLNRIMQLEFLYKQDYKLKEILNRQLYLKEWRENIGKEVFASKEGFHFMLITEYPISYFEELNFETSEKLIFTEEMFNSLCVYYLNHSIEYITKELTERSIVSNSTNKLVNLIFEWELDCKQQLLMYYKNALKWK